MSKLQNGVIILLLLCILGVNVFLLKIVIDKYELLSTNPAILTAQSFDVDFCSCKTNNDKTFNFDQERIWISPKVESKDNFYEINFSQFNISVFKGELNE